MEMKTSSLKLSLIPPCSLCSISNWSPRQPLYRGSSHPEVLFVGVAPGRTEVKQGEPFLGRMGRVLEAILALVPWELPCGFANLICCRPCDGQEEPNRKPESWELHNCFPHFQKLVSELRPKCLVCLNHTTVKQDIKHSGLQYHIASPLSFSVEAMEHYKLYINLLRSIQNEVRMYELPMET